MVPPCIQSLSENILYKSLPSQALPTVNSQVLFKATVIDSLSVQICKQLSKFDHVSQCLSELNWLPFRKRIHFQAIAISSIPPLYS